MAPTRKTTRRSTRRSARVAAAATAAAAARTTANSLSEATNNSASASTKKEEDPAWEMIFSMRRREKHFRSICRQLVLMNNDIRYLRHRYERAIRQQRHGFRYAQRLRLVTLEGVRNMFTEWAHAEADKLDAMENELKEVHDIDWSDVAEA